MNRSAGRSIYHEGVVVGTAVSCNAMDDDGHAPSAEGEEENPRVSVEIGLSAGF